MSDLELLYSDFSVELLKSVAIVLTPFSDKIEFNFSISIFVNGNGFNPDLTFELISFSDS